MKKEDKYKTIKQWDESYNGAGIYGIFDDNGKYYIGQALHIQNRLHVHRRNLNRVANGLHPSGIENQNLVNAVRDGVTFNAKILHRIPWYETTKNILRFYEWFYLNLYGGYENTYNDCVIYSPFWNNPPDNEIKIKIDFADEELYLLNYIENNGDIELYIKELIRSDIANH